MTISLSAVTHACASSHVQDRLCFSTLRIVILTVTMITEMSSHSDLKCSSDFALNDGLFVARDGSGCAGCDFQT